VTELALVLDEYPFSSAIELHAVLNQSLQFYRESRSAMKCSEC